ncbi:aminoacyl-histidine dipeptidase [Prosthecochloris sp. SCSIO W1101]|uniref:aminoacyl-histidine dipeptidase n=1 Tax=Prosthecochloris sp. SCSIO W1101 TaxID=2992242 RepID=UPI00223E7468|nr:aminoacyl-histidine dipeptidase [Prosthecochloris sp. SCSIO W1101]UZJ42375.1 aminoacyl-histidine dipeptidase [Prosthecochloris sp. SCSIO W1101]
MSEDILGLEPQEVWKYFYSLTRVPRPSGHEEKVRSFIADFGKNLGLETIVDDIGNVVIRKPAVAGLESREGVVLQAHLDMVPQKDSSTDHDFEQDPIEAVIDGDWLRADGTTLGADNGIGVAAAMAVLASTTLAHGPIEALFTCEEETGMTGAFGLKAGQLRGGILMNLDSEDEGELFIGCAGGLEVMVTLDYDKRPVPEGHAGFMIGVSGLKGGHSGMDIHLGRGNANKIMNRLLCYGHERHGLKLASIEGGTLRNAIPRESKATVVVPAEQSGCFLDELAMFSQTVQRELAVVDSGLRVITVPVEKPEYIIETSVVSRLLHMLYALPNGVMRMSDEMPGLVETSNNLAVVASCDGALKVECLLRSSVDSARDDLGIMIRSVARLAGAELVFGGSYPGWKPDPESTILKSMREVYKANFGKPPEIKAVHAGLECGIIGSTYPELDMISFGPTIRYPHSPDEKVHIASVGKFWNFLVEALENVPEA